jgi:hypothetical protein
VLSVREPSLIYHLVKRVVIEEQWAVGTTAEQYVADLRRGAMHSQARLAVMLHRGEYLALVVAPTANAVPAERLGPQWQPDLLVVCSVEHGMLRTGYQFSTLNRIDDPPEVRWLR